jgi:hypothetical protein
MSKVNTEIYPQIHHLFRRHFLPGHQGNFYQGRGNVETQYFASQHVRISRRPYQAEGVKKENPITTRIRTATTAIAIIAQSGSPNMFVLFFSEFIVPP